MKEKKHEHIQAVNLDKEMETIIECAQKINNPRVVINIFVSAFLKVINKTKN